MKVFNSIIVLGATASGKTRLATGIAALLNGAIISADSRQLYKELTIGSGKDLQEYTIKNKKIPYYLIDVAGIEQGFHLYDYIKHFIIAFDEIKEEGMLPVICGGTGLYLDAVLKKHEYVSVPVDKDLRDELQSYSKEELLALLSSNPYAIEAKTDTSTKKRMIRAIEIGRFLQHHELAPINFPSLHPLIFGIALSADDRRERISQRLLERFDKGMIEEVKQLLGAGINPETLLRLGLEYHWITRHLLGELSYDEMLTRLESEIHRYAKRQMTWFRKMEREGFPINLIDGKLPLEEQINMALEIIKKTGTITA